MPEIHPDPIELTQPWVERKGRKDPRLVLPYSGFLAHQGGGQWPGHSILTYFLSPVEDRSSLPSGRLHCHPAFTPTRLPRSFSCMQMQDVGLFYPVTWPVQSAGPLSGKPREQKGRMIICLGGPTIRQGVTPACTVGHPAGPLE